MKMPLMVFMLLASLIFSSSLLFAGEFEGLNYIASAGVGFDSRYYPELAYTTGGAEGHSGAYVAISVGVKNYSALSDVRVTAEHKAEGEFVPDFEATLREAPQECLYNWPPFWNVDQYWTIRLKPEDWMMFGKWEVTLKYTDFYGENHESVELEVDRFSFPPEPTGIQQIRPDRDGNPRILWNSIGTPGAGEIEYRVMHHIEGTFCVDKAINIKDASALGGRNRIRATLPVEWELKSGDLIRVENRIYDGSRYDRGVRYFYYFPLREE